MTSLLNLILLVSLVIAGLDVLLSPRAKITIRNHIFYVWYHVTFHSPRAVALAAIQSVERFLDKSFGTRFFSSRYISRVIAINTFIFFFVWFGYLLPDIYYYNFVLSDTRIKEQLQLHVEHHERLRMENLLSNKPDGEKRYHDFIYSTWVNNIKSFSGREYARYTLFNFHTNYAFFLIIGLINSIVCSYVSLWITHYIIRRITIDNLLISISLDFLTAILLISISFTTLLMLMSGIIVNSYYVWYARHQLLLLLDIDPARTYGLFPTIGDYVDYYGLGMRYHTLEFARDIWGNFFSSMSQVLRGRLAAVDPEQAFVNWTIVLSAAPTLLHLNLILFFLLMKKAEPISKGPVERVLAWLHEHPKGPIAAIGFMLAGFAAFLRYLIGIG